MNCRRGPFGALVALVFSLTFVFPPAEAFPDIDRRQRRASALPPSSFPLAPWVKIVSPYGIVQEVHRAAQPDSPLIIFLQDVHEVEEAQRNLASLVRALHDDAGIQLVGLEGAVGAFDQAEYRVSAFPTVTQSVAESLFKLGYLTGPETAAMASRDPPTLWGVEDFGLYRKNIRAFFESENQRGGALAAADRWETALNDVSERLFSPALKEFQTQRRAFQAQAQTSADYARFLWRAGSPPPDQFPQIALLLELSEREKSLDLKAAEAERATFLRSLARALTRPSLSSLAAMTESARAGTLSAGAYYRALFDLAARTGVRLDEQKNLKSYASYLALSETLNQAEVQRQLDRLERWTGETLAVTADQRYLVAADRILSLAKKLISHVLTPSEWEEFEREQSVLAAFRSTLSRMGGAPISAEPALAPSALTPFHAFCQTALDRNEAMARRLAEKMESDGTRTAILVAGGFHTEGLTRWCRRQGLSYIVISPRFNVDKAPPRTLQTFTREPTPLEQLIAGSPQRARAPPPVRADRLMSALSYPLLTQADPAVPASVPAGGNRRETARALARVLQDSLGRIQAGLVESDRDAFERFQSQFRLMTGLSSRVLDFRGRRSAAMRVRKSTGEEVELLVVSNPNGTAASFLGALPENPVYSGSFNDGTRNTQILIYDLKKLGLTELGPVTWARDYVEGFWAENKKTMRRLAPVLVERITRPTAEEEKESEMETLHDRLIEQLVHTGKYSAEQVQHFSQHMFRMRNLAKQVGKGFRLSPKDKSDLRLATVAHDIGKYHKNCVDIFLDGRVFDHDSEERRALLNHETVLDSMLEEMEFPLPEDVDIILKVHSALGHFSTDRIEQIPRVRDRHVRLALILAMMDVADGARDLHRPYIKTRLESGAFPSPEELRAEFRKYSAKLSRSNYSNGDRLAEQADREFDDLLTQTWFRIATEKTLFEYVLSSVSIKEPNEKLDVTFNRLSGLINKFGLLNADTPPELWWPSFVEKLWLTGKSPDQRDHVFEELIPFVEQMGGPLLPLTQQMSGVLLRGSFGPQNKQELFDRLEELFDNRRSTDRDQRQGALRRYLLGAPEDVHVTVRVVEGHLRIEMLEESNRVSGKENPAPWSRFLSPRFFKNGSAPKAIFYFEKGPEHGGKHILEIPYAVDRFGPWHISTSEVETVGKWLENMYEGDLINSLNDHIMSSVFLRRSFRLVTYGTQRTYFISSDGVTRQALQSVIEIIAAHTPDLRDGGAMFDQFSIMTQRCFGITPTRWRTPLVMKQTSQPLPDRTPPGGNDGNPDSLIPVEHDPVANRVTGKLKAVRAVNESS